MLPPVLPLPLNATSYDFTVHCAVIVTVPPFVVVRLLTF